MLPLVDPHVYASNFCTQRVASMQASSIPDDRNQIAVGTIIRRINGTNVDDLEMTEVMSLVERALAALELVVELDPARHGHGVDVQLSRPSAPSKSESVQRFKQTPSSWPPINRVPVYDGPGAYMPGSTSEAEADQGGELKERATTRLVQHHESNGSRVNSRRVECHLEPSDRLKRIRSDAMMMRI